MLLGSQAQTIRVVSCGVLTKLAGVLKSDADHLHNHALWALGELAALPTCREYLGRMHVSLLIEGHKSSYQSGAICKFIRNRIWPDDDDSISMLLTWLIEALDAADAEILTPSCWAVAYLLHGYSGTRNKLVERDFITRRFIELACHDCNDVQAASLCAIGLVLNGNEIETNTIVGAGVLDVFASLLQDQGAASTHRLICWAVSNLVLRKRVIKALLDTGVLSASMQMLLTVCATEGRREDEEPLLQEVIILLKNTVYSCDSEQLWRLATEHGWLDGMLHLLSDFHSWKRLHPHSTRLCTTKYAGC
jgi:hypothetical protein